MIPAVVSHTATSEAHVTSLFRRYRREGRPADLDALVERHLPLALHLARRYGGSAERDDLEQVAALGLVKAIDRFDPDRGIAFSSFAVPTILGELKRYFRDLGWSVRVPRVLQELAASVDAATERLTVELRRTPTAAEVAVDCDTTVELVLEARATSSAHRPESLDRPVGDDDAGSLGELLGSDDPGYDEVDRAWDIHAQLAPLPTREQTIVRLRFEDDLTQRDIGQLLGISQMQVSRLLREAVTRLRDAVGDGAGIGVAGAPGRGRPDPTC
jgi:RNA polymerase sigma-B factor